MNILPRRLPGLVCLAVLIILSRPAIAASGLELARQLNEAFVQVAEKVTPAVVVITVTQKTPTYELEDLEDVPDDFLPPELRRRYRERFNETPRPRSTGQGSGTIIRENGYILSNRHVVEDAERIEVRLKDGRKFAATVRGTDAQSDVAVLKIEAEGLPAARWADSDKTRVGELAIAIGAPYSLDYTVTFGHVSAKSRADVVPAYVGGAIMDQDFIQTDANINPGNSGGPLVNIEGEVIGINTMIRGLQTGIGFAIPSNLAREISDQIIAEGKFTRAWLGVSIRGLRDDAEFRELHPGVPDGVVIRAILPEGPAAKSDLRPTDIITAVDGRPVGTPQELRNEIRGKKVGHSITLDVSRAGKAIQVKVEPGEWVEEKTVAAAAPPETAPATNPAAGLGVTVAALTEELVKKYNVKQTDGVVITSVEEDSMAARKGLQAGDVITAINHRSITNLRQFQGALRRADLKKGLLLNLVRGETAHFEVLKDTSK